MATHSSIITLGIVVVYLVPEAAERLLELHLRQIKKHTRVPYTIFGCATRLSVSARAMLAANPRVLLCECVSTTATGGEEHSHYLDQLVCAAIDSGATHVVTLHVDSFPVRSDWVEKLVKRISDRCPLAAAEDFYTACMMFTREFYIRCKPSFRVTATERESAEYARFLEKSNVIQHSGVGYLFRAHMEGVSGQYLQVSSTLAPGSQMGEIYDDLVFHLGGGARLDPATGERSRRDGVGHYVAKWAVTLARNVTTVKVRRSFRQRFPRFFQRFIEAPSRELWQQRARPAVEELVASPESYIDRIREAGSRERFYL